MPRERIITIAQVADYIGTLRDGEAEVKRRDAGEAARTPLADAVGTVVGMLAAWQPQ